MSKKRTNSDQNRGKMKLYRQRNSLPLDAPYKYTRFIAYMQNFSDLTSTKRMVQMLVSSEENFRVIYNVYGSADEDCQKNPRANFENPLGKYSRLEFLGAQSFYQYCEAYLPICPDGIMEITSHSYCPSKTGTTVIVGTFLYRGTLITSPQGLEQVYEDKERVKIEKLDDNIENKEKPSLGNHQGTVFKDSFNSEKVLQEHVMSLDDWTPGYFSSQIPFHYPTEHILNVQNSSSFSSQSLSDTSLTSSSDDMKGIGEYLCNLSEDLTKKESTSKNHHSSAVQTIIEAERGMNHSESHTFLSFRCVGSMVLVFNDYGKVVCMEYHHKFIREEL